MSFILKEVKHIKYTTQSEIACPTIKDVADYISSQVYTVNKEKHFIVVPVNEHKADKGDTQ